VLEGEISILHLIAVPMGVDFGPKLPPLESSLVAGCCFGGNSEGQGTLDGLSRGARGVEIET
jgi:hypothetical protein